MTGGHPDTVLWQLTVLPAVMLAPLWFLDPSRIQAGTRTGRNDR